MLKMAVGQSDDVDPSIAVSEAIDQCRAELGGLAPRAAVLFVAFDSFDQSLVGRVRAAFPDVDLIGSTSSAQVSSVAGYLEDSVALAIFASDNIEMAVGMGTGIDQDAPAAARAAVAQAMSHLTKAPRVCIVLSEGVHAQRVSEALRVTLPSGVLVVGGGSGRDELGGESPTHQFCNDMVSTNGVAILLLAGPLAFSTAVGTGWRVLGPRGVVTRAAYGVIQQIDGRPALDWASGYLDLEAAGTFGNPLAIRDGGSDDWYLRVILRADENGGLRMVGAVPVGATVQLTTTNPTDMLEATAQAVERAQAAFPPTEEPSAALIFSCAARKFLLGSRAGREIASAKTLLPTTMPIAGMYCMGEIAPTGTAPGSHFLNETFVTLLLGS